MTRPTLPPVSDLSQRERLAYARALLEALCNEEITYADFQAAQAVERQAVKARNALRRLS